MLRVTLWPGIVVFGVAGLAAVLLAFVTVNLFAEAMANLGFLRDFGLTAVRLGALWQVAELLAWGAAALLIYLVFKICEVELVFRYFQWAGRLDHGMEARRKLRFRRDRDGAA